MAFRRLFSMLGQFYKTLWYTMVEYESHVGNIKLEEITITMVRESKPVKLLHWFEKNGYQINEVFKGIYYVIKDNHFRMQILVSKQYI